VGTSERTAGVVVVGVHRSGTSAAARMLNLLGLATARDDDLLRPTADNPAGHWESATMVGLNDRLLALLGARWWCPPARQEGMWATPAHQALEPHAAQALRQVHVTSPWVWKDPRLCVTLPFWRPLLPQRTLAVVVLRGPLEIAASLTHRDGLAVAEDAGAALWERSTQHLLPALHGLPVAVLRYAELVADPVPQAERLLEFLRAHIRPASPPQLDAIGDVVDPALRHERTTTEDEAASRLLDGSRRELLKVLSALPPRSDRFCCPPLPAETPGNDRLFLQLRVRAVSGVNVAARAQLRHATHEEVGR
jgi:hypothetical protein